MQEQAIHHGTGQHDAPLRLTGGSVWDQGKDYSLERRNHNVYLLLYTIGGEGYLLYEGKEHRLLPGTAFLIDCRRYQVYRTVGERWKFAFIHFDTDQLRSYVDGLYERYGAVFTMPDVRLMESRMRDVIALFNGYDRMAEHRAFGLMAQLLAMLYEAGDQTESSARISETTDGVIRLIEARYAEKLTLEDMARAVGLSKYYLARRFKEELGMTLYGYLTLYRISRSKILLQNTDLSVADIAEQVGFSGTSNFIRTFSEYESLTPHQYRRQWQ